MKGRLRAGETLVIATHNKGKWIEIKTLVEPYGILVRSAGEFGLTEPAETEDNFVGNARIKAHFAAEATNLPALADDSGICVDALNGAPGVWTADWAETPHGRDFSYAMTRVWQACEAAAAPHPRWAQFRCTLVLAWPDGTDEVFEGACAGQVVWPMRGTQGHGYDAIFQPDGYQSTFGEMEASVKNVIGHRADAFRKFVEKCFT